MTQDITGFGFSVTIIASNTFPNGLVFTQASDDADGVDFPTVTIGDATMGINGDLLTWSKAVPLPMTINAIPGSLDDDALQTLANANRVSQGRQGARDIITAVVAYPNGTFATLSGGKILTSQFGKSIAASGRQKTKPYSFTFQDFVEA